jgi:thiol-disulfide isomerase/thioredoxin
MKKVTTLLSVFIVSLFATMTLSAQENIDPNAPFLKDKNLPKFTLNLTNGKSFSNTQIPKTKYTCIIIFSPDCSHCQEEATELTKNADKFKSVFFIWNSYKEMADIKAFATKYGLDKQSNVIVGRDPEFSIPVFFRPRMTPFVALYEKGQLLKVYEQGVKVPELLKIIGGK